MRDISFSIVIPLYNKAAYIEHALRSVLAQTLAPVEIVVVDDGSTDTGPDLVQTLGISHLRLIRQPNQGVSAARNAGIAAACGDYVCFLDADDWYEPEFLATLSRLASKYPQAGLLATGYARQLSSGKRLRMGVHHSVAQGGLVTDFYRAWCKSCFFFTSSLAIQRTVFADTPIYFPVGERLGEDQDVWFRVAERYPVAYTPQPLAFYRQEVAGSATAAVEITMELPVFTRLAHRLQTGAIPAPLRRGAARLYASQLLNVARARCRSGDLAGAWALTLRPEARCNPLYWLRTLVHLTNVRYFKRGLA